MDIMVCIWLCIFIISIVVETTAPALVSIWFAAGSFVSLILSAFLGDSLIWLQILVFILVSVASVLAIRPFIIKSKKAKDLKSNIDSLIGQVGLVIDPITKFDSGTVKINGIIWTAEFKNQDINEIEKGQRVIIKEVQGNKLKVELYKEEKEE